MKKAQLQMGLLNPDFPLGASSTLFVRWRRIFGHFFRSSLKMPNYFRLIHVKNASKSASTIVSNPNENSGLKTISISAVFFFSYLVSVPSFAQMLTQKTTELAHGYRVQESQQVNVPGRWHSDQRFKFLYFKNRYLCQCTQFSISPSGKYAVYQIVGSNAIASFHREKGTVTQHDKLPSGKLLQVTWGKQERQIDMQIQAVDVVDGQIIKKRLTLK